MKNAHRALCHGWIQCCRARCCKQEMVNDQVSHNIWIMAYMKYASVGVQSRLEKHSWICHQSPFGIVFCSICAQSSVSSLKDTGTGVEGGQWMGLRTRLEDCLTFGVWWGSDGSLFATQIVLIDMQPVSRELWIETTGALGAVVEGIFWLGRKTKGLFFVPFQDRPILSPSLRCPVFCHSHRNGRVHDREVLLGDCKALYHVICRLFTVVEEKPLRQSGSAWLMSLRRVTGLWSLTYAGRTFFRRE